jgi:(1->4)-alpha-D-glucan 1-alpha-D-glucosylmutase
VADFYQGSELWDLNLPDPDNRRPVDFALRGTLLQSFRERSIGDRANLFSSLFRHWHDGTIKLAVLSTLLAFRRSNSLLFEEGQYEPLPPPMGFEEGVCAFFRTSEQEAYLAVASLDARLQPSNFKGVNLSLGARSQVLGWKDLFTEKVIPSRNGSLELVEVFESLPIALLVPTN